MTGWMTYKGLELPDSAVGDAGNKLTDDLKLLADGVGSALPMAADSYVIAMRGENDIESAANLRAAYAAAKLLTPGGNALSATNRAVCFVPPGRYDFGTGDANNHGLVLDEEFIDLIGMGDSKSTLLHSDIPTMGRGTIEQIVDDVTIANLTLQIGDFWNSMAYYPLSNLSRTNCTRVIFNSISGKYSMRPSIDYSGIYVSCAANGLQAFGGGSGGVASGIFIECVGGQYSFGGNSGTASGVLMRCRLGTQSTLGASSWNGTFTGLMEGCNWTVTGTNQTALRVGTGARVYNSTLIATGTGKSIDAASAVNAVIAQCRLNKGIGTNVTNLVTTPYNVDDANIS